MGYVGALLGTSWRPLGPFWDGWGHLDHLGTRLGRPWPVLGFSAGLVGLARGPLGARAVIGGVLGRRGVVWASLGAFLCDRSLS